MTVLSQNEMAQHLRLGTAEANAEAELLTRLSEAAQDYVEQYLGRAIPFVDNEGVELPLPASVKSAILLVVGDLYENREGQFVGVSAVENPAVDRLLHFYRKGLGI